MTPRTRSPRRSSAAPTPSATSRRSQKFVDAGFDHVYVHQVGPDQEGFIRFYAEQILPAAVAR